MCAFVFKHTPGVRGCGSCGYLLWTRACSTLLVLSEAGVPAEF